MKDHSECVRGYHHLSKAWYADACMRGGKDELMIGYYYPDGSTPGEFAIRWVYLNGEYVPKLEVFDDAWSALHGFADLIERLAELAGQNADPEKVAEILKSLGIKDMTRTVQPHHP